ncbi:MAG: hypothetical protein H5U40_09540, partial [Polyangiaceae bacterium]|nr:hypothetical protein [Polyangiaceae bacterium]
MDTARSFFLLWFRAFALLAALVVSGCGDDDGATSPDGSIPDAEVGDDGGVEPDGGEDGRAEPDGGEDGGAEPDGGEDGGAEPVDAGVDAGPPPEPFEPVFLSDVDKTAFVSLGDDRLSAEWLYLNRGGVRSTRAIAPGEGVFYFEAEIPFAFDELQIGVATAAANLAGYSDDPDAGLALHTGGQIWYDGASIRSFDRSKLRYGFVIDYRGTHPVVHVLLDDGAGNIESRLDPPRELTSITEPVYATFTGIRRATGTHVAVNFGNDTLNFPFAIDARAALIAAGHHEVADALVLGFGGTHANPWNAPPSLIAPAQGATVYVGGSTMFEASASDAEDGSLDATILWEVLSTGYGPERVVGTGPSFTYTPAE